MPEGQQSREAVLVTTLIAVGAPLFAAILISLASPDYGIHATVAGALIALALLFLRLRTLPGGGSGTKLAHMLVAGDIEAATGELGKLNLLTPETAVAIEKLRVEWEQQHTARKARREALVRMGLELTSLGESLSLQTSALEDVRRAADGTLGSQQRTSISLDDLSHSAEESSSSIIQMVTMNNQVRDNVHHLASSVDETTTAIEEMTFSSKEVANNIEELSTAAEETAASMNEMDVSISQVEANATETSRLSEQVTRDAETGVGAINHTIRGIDDIKESSRVAAEAITNLGQKINQIGNILNVIDDVAEQTNLLALNAAIIAAQAGEHGRGFAVVADEIKALAERTGSSTKEIAGLIRTIQDESRNAVTVMSKGVEDVEEGVRLGHNAEDALRKIVESAKRSTLMIHAIAQATVEQAKGSKQVTNAISRIAETVQQIAFATAEQAKGAEHIMQSAERMKVITQQVERSADEQNRGGQQVTQSIENIREMAEHIGDASKEHKDTNRHLSTAIAAAAAAGERCVATSTDLQRILGDATDDLDEDSRPLAIH